MIKEKGFTILELLVTITIFSIMTALVLARYGTFNQGVLLTNLAYDVALTIRNAQSYGLNVKSSSRIDNKFDRAYGVHFDVANNTKLVFFVDSDGSIGDGKYTPNASPSEILSTTVIKRGSKIYNICADACASVNDDLTVLDVMFKRPDPNTIFSAWQGYSELNPSSVQITVGTSDGILKKIIVNSVGQIYVKN